MNALPEEADELFKAPLDEFTRRRNEIVKRLKAAGDKEGAAEVGALKKPPVTAWALNQVARTKGREVAELIEADRALGAPRSRNELRMASEKRNRAIGHITQLAIETLEKGGHAGAASAHKIMQTLLAAGTDEEARTALLSGTLLRDFAPGGLGGGDIWTLPEESPETENPSETRRRAVLEKEIALLAQQADGARTEAARADKEANRARLASDQAEAEAERLRRKADQVAAALDRKKAELE